MMQLLRWRGPDAVRVEYRSGRPRDVDGPVLVADVLGRLLSVDERRTPDCRVFANGYTDCLQRLWPMVEAVAGRPVDVVFVSDPANADVAVDAEVDADGARAEAVRAGGEAAGLQEEPIDLTDPAALLPPEVGGLDMPAWWLREEDDLIALRGGRCPACSRVEYPAPPAGCPNCRTALEPQVLATTGDVLTWTVDRLYESRVETGMAVIELDGGGRFYGQLADGWPTGALRTGARARLVPRVLHSDERRTAYFWKVIAGGGAQDA